MDDMDTTRGLELRTRVVTQILTRPFTTITTLVTLGDSPASTPTPSTSSSSSFLSEPTTTPAPDLADTNTVAPAPSTSLTPAQLGALLGSVFGLVFLALLACFLLAFRRRQRALAYQNDAEAYYHYYYNRGSDEVSEEGSGGDGVRGGTPAWNLHAHRYYAAAQRARARAAAAATSTWTTVPPPVRFPPTPRHTTYSQTRERQIRGVGRYP